MGIPKFKVGDKVKVLRASTFDEDCTLWGDVWFPFGMDKFIGQEYIIKTVTRIEYKYPSYRLENYNFPEFVLQDTTIGKQLLFPFMEKK